MSQSESYNYLIFRITGSFLNRCLGTLDCSHALLTRNSRGPSRTVLDFGLKGGIPMFCLVLWLVPLLSIGPSWTMDSVCDISPTISPECISRITSLDMDIHHIGPEHISNNISRVYLRKNISGHGYTSHWSGACLWKYVQSVSPENHLRRWIYITLVRSISPKISTE